MPLKAEGIGQKEVDVNIVEHWFSLDRKTLVMTIRIDKDTIASSEESDF